MSKIYTYYLQDDITFKAEFQLNGVAQTPDAASAKVKIVKDDNTVIKDESASITGMTIYYKWTDMSVGNFTLYFTAKFNSGEDERTGIIEFKVLTKGD